MKVNKETENSNIVRIIPVEKGNSYKDKTGIKKQVSRHWQADRAGRFFLTNLSAQQLKPALVRARVKIENLFLKNEGDVIIYQYKSRPMIKLDVKKGQFYSLATVIEEFGKEAVQHQAHIVLEILKTNGLSNAVRGKEDIQTNTRQLLSRLKTYNKIKGK